MADHLIERPSAWGGEFSVDLCEICSEVATGTVVTVNGWVIATCDACAAKAVDPLATP